MQELAPACLSEEQGPTCASRGLMAAMYRDIQAGNAMHCFTSLSGWRGVDGFFHGGIVAERWERGCSDNAVLCGL
jgi:hypothetical protein